MERLPIGKTISEPAREIDVYAEAEVVVVGGGPAGVTAAIAAAREGADVILVERYGHLGGMATGGLVLMINQLPSGQCQEWLDRLERVNGARDVTKSMSNTSMTRVIMVDPELLKCILSDMSVTAGVKLLLHSWGTRAVVNGNSVTGVIFESKSGRLAVMGQIIIDATGDGDIFASAGAEFDGAIDYGLRSSQMALVFRIGNVDSDKFVDFRITNPQKWLDMREELDSLAGFRIGPLPSARSDVVWVNNFVKGLNPLKIGDLTRVEVDVRKIMLPVYEYLKSKVPGFEDSFIYDSAAQIGTRGSRRLTGEYVLTRQDVESRKTFPDTVAVFPQGVPTGSTPESMARNIGLPYRCLVPIKMDGLLVAGRCFSSDPAANTMFNVIPHCIVMGQAAGTAAALAVKSKVSPRHVDYQVLRKHLTAQGISLPG